jgi:chorismate synthase
MLQRLRFLTAGESHGPKLSAILEGMPAGVPLDSDVINEDLARRQTGFGRGGRMKIEQDEVTITSGVAAGLSTGAPIAMELANADYKNWKEKDITPMTTPRPGHADLTGAIKYAHADLRLSLERASARETAMRVCVGGVCKQLLGAFGIEVGGYVTQIGPLAIPMVETTSSAEYQKRFAIAKDNEFALPDGGLVDTVREDIRACMKDKDTLGGIFEIVALGLPVGLGSYTHWDRRLEAQIGMALLSIQAMKGVEFAHAFQNATRRGTQVHDEIFADDEGNLIRKTNRAGGFEGGITTGSPIVARVAMKPISTTLNPLQSIDLAKGEASPTVYERSDFCAVPRAIPIGEAMMAFVLANALLEKLGGDSLSEMKKHFTTLAQNKISDLHLKNQPWRFDYEQT